MGTRTFQAAVVALALAVSAPIAHAGGAGAGALNGGALVNCYLLLNGTDAPQTLTLTDQFGTRSGVRIGRARLLCTPVSGVSVDSGDLVPGDFSGGDHITCYDTLSFSGANVREQVVDPLTSEPSVRVSVPLFTCIQSFKCPVGETCPPQ